MDFPTLCTILKEWKIRLTDVDEFDKHSSLYYHNGKRVIQLLRELAEFIKTHEPAMRQWMITYLDKNRKEIFAKWWSIHVSEWASDQMERFPKKRLHPNTQQEWDRLFGARREACFDLAKRVTVDAFSIKDVTKCNDLTILAIHEGRECDHNMWECYFCEERESAWKKELQRRLLESSHPLLNPDKAKSIHYRWVYKEDMSLLGDWEPPHVWGTLRAHHEDRDCYNIDEYKDYMCKRRAEEYTKTGQTPMQAIAPILFIPAFYGGWGLWPYKKDNTEFEAFILLWNKLDILPLSLELDLQRLNQIEEMY